MNSFWNSVRSASVAMPAALALLTGCASNRHYVADGPKFRDEAAANLIVRYSAENTVCMVRPDVREGAFQRIFTREELCRKAAAQPGDRNLAVVIINRFYVRSLEQQEEQKWVDALEQMNYRRVVFLRATNRDHVNGLRIVNDTLLSARTPDPAEVHLTSAAPSPALAH